MSPATNAREGMKACLALLASLVVCSSAYGAAGDALVADLAAFGGNGGILRVSSGGAAQTKLSGEGAFVDPSGVALGSDGTLYVADFNGFGGGSGEVIRVDPITGAQRTLASGGNLVDPWSVAVQPDGQLLVADPNAFGGGGGVIRVDPNTGAQTPVSSGGVFVDPIGIAVAGDGSVYVVDQNAFGGGGGVIRVDPNTGAQTTLASTGMVDPIGIAVTGNDLLVADQNPFSTARVIRLDRNSGVQTVLSAGGSLNSPRGISLAPSGSIVVADQNAFGGPGGLISIDPSSGTQTPIATGGSFSDPAGLAIVPNLPPIAAFSVSPDPPLIKRSTTFDASTSRDPDGAIGAYHWDLDGNGTYETPTGSNPLAQHTFDAVGIVKVGLRVVDDQGTATDLVRQFQVYDIAPPVLGKAVDLFPTGKVYVKPPETPTFQVLRTPKQVKVGATIDTKGGSVRLLSAGDKKKTQTATIKGGAFKVGQRPVRRAVTEFVLAQGREKPTANTACNRTLWAKAKGRFRTRGEFASATVRGTQWSTTDTCGSTTVAVKTGAVLVRDLKTGKQKTVKAGQSYRVKGIARKSRPR